MASGGKLETDGTSRFVWILVEQIKNYADCKGETFISPLQSASFFNRAPESTTGLAMVMTGHDRSWQVMTGHGRSWQQLLS